MKKVPLWFFFVCLFWRGGKHSCSLDVGSIHVHDLKLLLLIESVDEKCVFFFFISTSFLLYVSLSLMLPSQEMWSTSFSCFSQELWTKRGGVSLSFLIIILLASSSFSKCDFLSSRLNVLKLFRGGLEVCVWSDSLILPRQIHSCFSRKQISSQTFWWYTATICV